MFNLSVSPDFLAYLLAGLVAILFDWFPGLAAWFASLSELKKRQVMAGLLLGIVLAIYAGICGQIFTAAYTCDKVGFAALVQVFLIAAGINQGVHQLFKPSKGDPITWKAAAPGQGMVEYALILVLVAVVVIAALTLMGPLVMNVFESINASL